MYLAYHIVRHFLMSHGHHLVSRVYTMGSMFMLSEHASHAHSQPTNPWSNIVLTIYLIVIK
jgi:hypothetical protein